jgi:hypothetical protein
MKTHRGQMNKLTLGVKKNLNFIELLNYFVNYIF